MIEINYTGKEKPVKFRQIRNSVCAAVFNIYQDNRVLQAMLITAKYKRLNLNNEEHLILAHDHTIIATILN